MLEFIRNRASSWIVKFILGLIIVVFVFFGWGAYKSGKLNQVAKVNGQAITPQEYKSVYNQLLTNLKARFQGKLSNKLIEMFQLDKQALNQAIEQVLIDQKAQELGITVSDEELADYISNLEYFLTDKKFDVEKYKRLLPLNGMTPEGFENQIKKSMISQRVTSIITDAVKVTDKEVLEWYNFNNKKIDIKYAAFLPEEYPKESFQIKDDEIKTYYAENKENYTSEEMVNVAYLRFTAEDFKENTDIHEGEIKAYYDEHLNLYKTPEKVEARHILIKVVPAASEKEAEEAKTKILNIKKEILGGKSFEEAAKKYSEGPSASQGGYLGEFGRKDMVEPFSKAAFNLKAGEISEPVKTDFGWHLIKVEKNTPESVKPLELVKADIVEKLKLKKARLAAYDKADSIYEGTLKGAPLKEEAEAASLKTTETGYFTRKGPEKGILDPIKFAKEAFSFEIGETSEIIESGDNLYILQVLDKKAPKILPLDKIKDKITDKLILQKQDEKAKSDSSEYLKAVIAQKNINAGSKTVISSQVKEAKEVQRQGFIKGLGTVPELQAEIFKASAKGDKFSEEVIKSGKGYYVFSIEKEVIPSKEEFEGKKEELKKRMTTRKKNHFFQNWLDDCKKKSEITISKQFQS